jgi:hypothetical protein
VSVPPRPARCSCLGLHLLACCARTSRVVPSSFYTVCHAGIPAWTFLVDLAIAVKCFGVSVSYLLIVGDLMPLAVRHMQALDTDQPGEHLSTAARGVHHRYWRRCGRCRRHPIIIIVFIIMINIILDSGPGLSRRMQNLATDEPGEQEGEPVASMSYHSKQDMFAVSPLTDDPVVLSLTRLVLRATWGNRCGPLTPCCLTAIV